ncbi:MAG: hypothetical protein GKR91_05340 [Pseudomonadales bacterium]|nr:hypothetical protein [Pseudomonadales bacterium]
MANPESNIPPSFTSSVVYELPYEHEPLLDQSFGNESELFDLYYPDGGDGPFPVLVFVLGFPAPGFDAGFGFKLKDLEFYKSWARLIAASGMTAVLYSADDAEPGTLELMAYLRRNCETLKLDMNRIGIWSCSANVANAINVLNKVPDICCAALNYGYMLDLNGSTSVQDMAAQVHFANPNQGEASMPTVPMLVTKAGQDAFPGINEGIDSFVNLARERNIPVEFIDYEKGVHSFDVLDNTDESIAIVKRMVDFLKSHLLK